jgi:hypothetical protein
LKYARKVALLRGGNLPFRLTPNRVVLLLLVAECLLWLTIAESH